MKGDIEIIECRSCNSKKLTPIISLGEQYVVNFVKSKEDLEKIPKIPLELVLCEDCKLLQLKHNAPPESMWGEQYWYKSGINKMIRENLKEIVEEASQLVKVDDKDIILDIGCNDGTMLDFYDEEKNLTLVGFEPSVNVAEEAKSKGHLIINDFFNSENFKDIFREKKAKIITAISMFYDLEDPNSFLKDITHILDKKGLLIIQQNYLVNMLENNAFDNICHEHRCYYSITSLKPLLEKHGLEIFDIKFSDINGGSIRTLIRFKEKGLYVRDIDKNKKIIKIIEENEIKKGLDVLDTYKNFANRIDKIKNDLLEFLRKEKEEGRKICALGASTRGMVILQYFGLDSSMIDCIFDKNPDKEGKMPAGTDVIITSPENIAKYSPDYQIVLIWHIFNGIGEDEKEFLKKGGKFILPLPEMKIISDD